MMFKKTIVLLLFLLPCIGTTFSYAQHIAINNNVLFDVAGALSAGVEIPLSNKTSFEAYGSLRPWKREARNVHKHWMMQAQYRFWPCQVMNGFFYGPYLHFGEFNLGNHDLCFGLLKGLKPNRYEGWLMGAGMGAGYEYALAKHWNVGAELGLGYTFIDYKKYNCERCGKLKDDDVFHYVGLSRLALSVIYVF